MDAGTMKDYIEDLIQQVNTLEAQFRTLDAIIKQLQQQRDHYRNILTEFVKESSCVDCFVEDSRKDGLEINNWQVSDGHTIEGCSVAKLQRQYFDLFGEHND